MGGFQDRAPLFNTVGWLAAFLLWCLLLPSTGLAVPEIAISPAVLRLSVAPGQAITREIVVSNPGTTAYQVTAYAWDMWHDGLNRQYAPPGTFPRTIAKRTVITPATFPLVPGERHLVRFTIDIPQEATGGLYGVIFFEMGPSEQPGASKDSSLLMVMGRIGASIIVDTNTRPVTEGSRIEKLSIDPPTDTTPLRLVAKLLNPNETHLRPRATALILNHRSPVGRFTLNPILLLPGQHGVLEGTWPGTLPPGTYTLLITLVSNDHVAETLERGFHVD